MGPAVPFVTTEAAVAVAPNTTGISRSLIARRVVHWCQVQWSPTPRLIVTVSHCVDTGDLILDAFLSGKDGGASLAPDRVEQSPPITLTMANYVGHGLVALDLVAQPLVKVVMVWDPVKTNGFEHGLRVGVW